MRSVATARQASREQPRSGEVTLCFLTIAHATLPIPIRVVTEGVMGVSRANGLPVDYVKDGVIFKGLPFGFTLPSDDERAARATLVMANVDQEIGRIIDAIGSSPSILLELYSDADWSTSINAQNAREPIAAPVCEYRASYLRLRNVSVDALQVTAELGTYDLNDEPWPYQRMTRDIFGGLYRP